jgi:glycosyltransferase involved in cell wall biosynthesis
VLSQSLSDFEVVVVDDGSTDDGPEIVAAMDDPRIRVLRQTNLGAAAARNTGVSGAAGRWIALIDADDLWSPDHLENLVEAIQKEGVVFAFSNLRLESRLGKTLIDPRVASCLIDDYFAFALAHGGYPASASSVLIRRDHLVQAKLFREDVSSGEDVDTWCRLACRGSFFYSACPTATYNDVPRHDSMADNLAREAVFPCFAEHLPEMIDAGEIPQRLIASARRYVNFLLLEYARQLLDRGQPRAARAVLLKRCRPDYDPQHYFRRLARTSTLGHLLFRLSGKTVGG